MNPLRPTEGMEHDALIISHIVSAISHVSRRTGATGDALLPLAGGGGFNLSEPYTTGTARDWANTRRTNALDATLSNRMSGGDEHGDPTRRCPCLSSKFLSAAAAGREPGIPNVIVGAQK